MKSASSLRNMSNWEATYRMVPISCGSPHTQRYYDNIRLVDEGVAALVADMDRRFPDNGTAYIFTADHGMTDHASHGDGAPANVRTPLVTWGAGLSFAGGAEKRSAREYHDDSLSRSQSYSYSYGLSWSDEGLLARRVEIDQAQLAPLMSALLGLPCPVNNVGLLPVELLAGSKEFKARAAWANARQLLASYGVQADRVRSTAFKFVPYAPLADGGEVAGLVMKGLLESGDYVAALRLAQTTGRLAVEGLAYLQVRSSVAPAMTALHSFYVPVSALSTSTIDH
eukprot:scaffold9595_cov27-Prasinocladus_malaysianus.AAC.1